MTFCGNDIGSIEAAPEDRDRAGGAAAYRGHLNLCGAGLCIRLGAGASQYGDYPAGRSCAGGILPAKRPDSADDFVPYQPIRAAEAGLLAAGPSAGPQICDTGFDLWIKGHPLHHRRGCSVPICDWRRRLQADMK